MKNPYNINTQENEFLAWSEGYNCPVANPEANPYDDETDAKLARIWLKGFNTNTNRSMPVTNTSPTPDQTNASETQSGTVKTQSGINLALVPTDQLFTEVSRRLKEGEALLERVKKLLG